MLLHRLRSFICCYYGIICRTAVPAAATLLGAAAMSTGNDCMHKALGQPTLPDLRRAARIAGASIADIEWGFVFCALAPLLGKGRGGALEVTPATVGEAMWRVLAMCKWRFLFLYLVCMRRARLMHVMRGPCRGRSKRARSWRFKGAWRAATVVRLCGRMF